YSSAFFTSHAFCSAEKKVVVGDPPVPVHICVEPCTWPTAWTRGVLECNVWATRHRAEKTALHRRGTRRAGFFVGAFLRDHRSSLHSPWDPSRRNWQPKLPRPLP